MGTLASEIIFLLASDIITLMDFCASYAAKTNYSPDRQYHFKKVHQKKLLSFVQDFDHIEKVYVLARGISTNSPACL